MNKEEFIGKLQMVYVGDRNAFNEIVEDNQKLKNEIVYSKVEIDRLNNKVLELENINEKIGLALDNAENKVDRLNNIINKLEKYLIQMSDRSWDDNGAYDEVLDKLKELKENNK